MSPRSYLLTEAAKQHDESSLSEADVTLFEALARAQSLLWLDDTNQKLV